MIVNERGNLAFMEACCTPLSEGAVTAERAEAMAPVLSALADPTRLRIVSILLEAPDGSCCGCDMEEPLGLSQPTISHHLRVLREAGLVEGERQGRWVHYRVLPERLAEVANSLLPESELV